MASIELPGKDGNPFLLTVDDSTDAAYLLIRYGTDVDRTIKANKEVNLDLDKDGNVVGVEILRSDK
jgi:uncharacterized protein YuzE